MFSVFLSVHRGAQSRSGGPPRSKSESRSGGPPPVKVQGGPLVKVWGPPWSRSRSWGTPWSRSRWGAPLVKVLGGPPVKVQVKVWGPPVKVQVKVQVMVQGVPLVKVWGPPWSRSRSRSGVPLGQGPGQGLGGHPWSRSRSRSWAPQSMSGSRSGPPPCQGPTMRGARAVRLLRSAGGLSCWVLVVHVSLCCI